MAGIQSVCELVPIGPSNSGRLILPLLSLACDIEAWT
jgi:hypothetical protein